MTNQNPAPEPTLKADLVLPRPFCAKCGHDLTGAVHSAVCPECGRPLVEVLTREPRFSKMTRRYESPTRVLGLPLLSIATGPDAEGKMGRAKGYIAVGDVATGVFALGGIARGVVAMGGIAVGGVTFGGLSIGTFAAFGGGAIALLGSSLGGFSVGLMANGGLAVGALAQGGLAIGWLARGDQAQGVHAWTLGRTPDDATRALFDQFAWLLGPSTGGPGLQYGLGWTIAIALVVAFLAAIPLILARKPRDRVAEELQQTAPKDRF